MPADRFWKFKIQVDMTGGAEVSEGHHLVSAAGDVVTIESTRYRFCYQYDAFNDTQMNSLGSILQVGAMNASGVFAKLVTITVKSAS